ncbi:MAG: methyl-accepting chemotaxis protein [Pelosinus sp.]|nr:methyl-accepting chemotaxis protein [Pelosinus sp.]
MKRFPIIVQIVSMFVLVLALMVGVVGYTYYHLRAVGNEAQKVAEIDSMEMVTAKDAHTQFTRALLDMRGFLFYADGMDTYEKGYRTNIQVSYDVMTQYAARAENPELKAKGEAVKKLVGDYMKLGDRVIAAKRASDPNLNQITTEGRALVAAIDKSFSELSEAQKTYLLEKTKEMNQDVQARSRQALLVSAFIVLLALALGIWYSRSVSAPIKELLGLMAKASQGDLTVKAAVISTDEIGQLSQAFNAMIDAQSHIVKEVSKSAVELANASQELAASSEEVSAATNGIANDVQRVAEAMGDASRSSSETSQVLIELSSLIQIAKDKAKSASGNSEITITAAKDGKATVTDAMQSMNTIYTKTIEAEKVISLLNEYSKQIGMINESIAGIANQTNLLALNAAIEAARAGEAGKGFAVVADEVRKLAEQSNTEADNISQLISKITANTGSAVVAMKDSLTEVEAGVQAVSKAEKSLENILSAVADTVNDVNGIAKVTNEEVASSDKIVQLIENVASNVEKTEQDSQAVAAATEEITATVETIAASSQDTSAMAQKLQNNIVRFQI